VQQETNGELVHLLKIMPTLVRGGSQVLLPLDLHGDVEKRLKKIGQSPQALR